VHRDVATHPQRRRRVGGSEFIQRAAKSDILVKNLTQASTATRVDLSGRPCVGPEALYVAAQDVYGNSRHMGRYILHRPPRARRDRARGFVISQSATEVDELLASGPVQVVRFHDAIISA
jgi:hypothetical protein